MRGSARFLLSRLPTGGHRKDSATAMPPFDTGYAATERRLRRERRQDIIFRSLVVLVCLLAALAIYLAFN